MTLFAILTIGFLALCFGALLGYAGIRFKVQGDPIVEQIDELLLKLNVDNVVFPVASPTPKPLPMVKTLINAHLVATQQLKTLPPC